MSYLNTPKNTYQSMLLSERFAKLLRGKVVYTVEIHQQLAVTKL